MSWIHFSPRKLEKSGVPASDQLKMEDPPSESGSKTTNSEASSSRSHRHSSSFRHSSTRDVGRRSQSSRKLHSGDRSVGERSSDRSGDRSGERSSDRSGDRSGERSSDRATSRSLLSKSLREESSSNSHKRSVSTGKYTHSLRSHSRSRSSDISKPQKRSSSRTSSSRRASLGGSESNNNSGSSKTLTNDDAAAGTTTAEGSVGRSKKTKLEKIEQLQAKNALYKEEFKRVQKDRKCLKKELEVKNAEIDALTKKIERYVAEVSNLKTQLSPSNQDDKEQKEKQKLEVEHDYSKLHAELQALQEQVQIHNQEIETANANSRSKDAEISQLLGETNMLRKEIRESNLENKRLVAASAGAAGLVKQMSALEEERDRLYAELKITVERATALVKEREDAIADLLKENDEFKNEIARRDLEKENLMGKLKNKQAEDGIQEEEENEMVTQLRLELVAVNAQLEESQDRNVLLEEDLEGWNTKGQALMKEVARLQDEADELKEKLKTTEDELKKAEERAEKAMEAAADADDALEEAEEEFERAMLEAAAKHKVALLEAKTRYAEEAAAKAASGSTSEDQQSILLKAAVASQQRRPLTDRRSASSSWFSIIAPSTANVEEVKSPEAPPDLTKENSRLVKRIDELEDLMDEQEDEIKALRSELVQVRTTFNETVYKNKKQVEQLEHENRTYAARVSELEVLLQASKLQAVVVSANNISLQNNSSLSSNSD